jgi:hypothetical protein
MRRRRHDSWDKSWVTIAAVVGVVAVVVIALAYFFGFGGIGGPAGTEPAATGSGGSTAAASVQAGPTPAVVVRETTPVSVPDEGVYVRITYLGSFTGSYGMADSLVQCRLG